MKKERSFQQNVLRQLDITCKKIMTPTSHHIQNSTQMGHRPMCKSKNYKTLRKNIRINLEALD